MKDFNELNYDLLTSMVEEHTDTHEEFCVWMQTARDIHDDENEVELLQKLLNYYDREPKE